jgi:hypothetical protein
MGWGGLAFSTLSMCNVGGLRGLYGREHVT